MPSQRLSSMFIQLRKFHFLVFGIFFIFLACKEEQVESPELDPEGVVLFGVESGEYKYLFNTLKQEESQNGRVSSSLFNDVSLDTSWVRHDPVTGVSNYSLTMRNNGGLTKRMFLLTEYNEMVDGHIMEFEADADWVILNEVSFSGFTGIFRILSLEEELLRESSMMDGQEVSSDSSATGRVSNFNVSYECEPVVFVESWTWDSSNESVINHEILYADFCQWVAIRGDNFLIEYGGLDPFENNNHEGGSGSSGAAIPKHILDFGCAAGYVKNENGECVKETCLGGRCCDENGNVILSCMDDLPCDGDLVKNMEITSSGASGKNGGRYGYTRTNGTKFHDGLDISTSIGTYVFSVNSGRVVGLRKNSDPLEYAEYSYGNYVIIETEKQDGTKYFIKYNHLDHIDVEMGHVIGVGMTIGRAGATGNAAGKSVKTHVHLQARKRAEDAWLKANPEDYLATKYDSLGNVSSDPCD